MKQGVFLRLIPMKQGVLFRLILMKQDDLLHHIPLKQGVLFHFIPMKQDVLLHHIPLKQGVLLRFIPMKQDVLLYEIPLRLDVLLRLLFLLPSLPYIHETVSCSPSIQFKQNAKTPNIQRVSQLLLHIQGFREDLVGVIVLKRNPYPGMYYLVEK